MNFGKIAFGALLLAVGVVLLAVRVGWAHPDTPIILLRYWPVLLIAFGLALLAGVFKNPALGCFAVLLILGGVVFGIWWLRAGHQPARPAPSGSSLDLSHANVSSLIVRVYTFAGAFDLGATPSKTLIVARRDAASDSAGGYALGISGGKAVLTAPRSGGTFSWSSPGSRLAVRAPEALPLSLNWSGRLGSMHADLSHLRPTRCSLHEIFASGRLDIGPDRPDEIHVWGFASSLTIRVPADTPMHVISESPLVVRNLPSDFEQHVEGNRERGVRVDAALGRGRSLRVFVDGALMRIAVERMPVVSDTRHVNLEDKEWRPASTASRSL